MSNYTQSDYERDLAIIDNAPDGDVINGMSSLSTQSRRDGKALFVRESIEGNWKDWINVTELQKAAIAQYETIEKLKGAALFIDSFIEQYENEEVRVHDNAGCGYLDVRLSEHIDFSELVSAIKELTE